MLLGTLVWVFIGALGTYPGLTAQEIPLPGSGLLAIETLRKVSPPGGEFLLDEVLTDGTNYRQQVVSYTSEGLKIYGLLTIPKTPVPEGGFPSVIFIHGHIPPAQYSTVKSYGTYQPALARAGFVTFKPDLRGHGRSEGSGKAHFSDVFTLDVLAALAYLKKTPQVNPRRIGYWGHSNGGEIGLRLMVSNQEIKAYSLWSGVVGSYTDMLETFNPKIRFMRVPNDITEARGLPRENPTFWTPVEAYNFLNFLRVPVELHHAQGDASVPVELSRSLAAALRAAGKTVTLYESPGDNHNINGHYTQAWDRTINFFRENL